MGGAGCTEQLIHPCPDPSPGLPTWRAKAGICMGGWLCPLPWDAVEDKVAHAGPGLGSPDHSPTSRTLPSPYFIEEDK